MEKLIYTAWGVQQGLLSALKETAAQSPCVNLVDERVAPGQTMVMQSVPPLPEAVISFWLDSAFNRAPVEQILKAHTTSFAGYVVSESCPLDKTPPDEWFTQIAFLKKPEKLSRTQWLHHWLEEHTKIAIDTQSTHYYAQNMVARCLTPDAAHWDGIIEERFPLAALTDEYAFYAAQNDKQLAKHKRLMMESCSRFIDFRNINVVLTSTFM